MNLYGVQLELTRDCNLRCTYCAVSQPTYQPISMKETDLGRIVEELQVNGVRHVQMNGHGETTLFPKWVDTAETLLKSGFELSMTTNMARELTDAEVDSFSRFSFVETSLDSTDRVQNRDIRRKADVRTIYSNMLRIKACAMARGDQCPRLGFSIVVYDKNVEGLEKLIGMGLALGVSHFQFCNLVRYDDIDGVESVQPLSVLRGEKLANAKRSLASVKNILDRAKVEYEFGDGMLSVLDLMSEDGNMEDIGRMVGTKTRLFVTPGPGQTRDCLDPWSFAQVRANGEVSVCCFSPAVGRISPGTSLRSILDGDDAESFRDGLLGGEMRIECKNCWMRPLTTPELLKAKVDRHQEQNDKYAKVSIHARINEIHKVA